MTVHAFIDGASRNNPGEAGIGIILKDEKGSTLKKEFGYIGKATNNIAEYKALLACLKTAHAIPCNKLIVHSDSELLVRQMNGEYRVKDATLKRYFVQAHQLIQSAPFEVEVKHIVREHNREADQLANLGIDTKRRVKV
ncbi:MAG TPA: ribonuclease HI family protein [Bacteroidota bacterium]|nr:ribonuclease HI family protein [Bacteroidota bacterium]